MSVDASEVSGSIPIRTVSPATSDANSAIYPRAIRASVSSKDASNHSHDVQHSRGESKKRSRSTSIDSVSTLGPIDSAANSEDFLDHNITSGCSAFLSPEQQRNYSLPSHDSASMNSTKRMRHK